ncbi:hypothetical protein DL771_012151 [Monosporascus sp. 5C6A]|nr:hypothetical protein DL771_012151 [Monosporascus sp. 5C6A]
MEQSETERNRPDHPAPTSARLELEPKSHRVASRTTDQARPTAEYALSTSSYRYSPLLEHGSIRLLRLMPHENKKAPIQCRIFEYPLQKPGPGIHRYEALSYVWGSEDNRQPIYIQSDNESNDPLTGNGRCLLVTTNLYTALSYLRDRLLERIIWIDAICINQEDNDEKGQQVQFMAKIYANANCVIVWLGEAAGDSDQAFEALRNAAEEQRMHPVTDKPNQHHQAILTLLERPWFQRIWVLQEVAAARHILIKCGLSEIDGYAFYLGVNALNLSYNTCPDLQGLIPPITYLIQGAIFRHRHQMSQSGRFSLCIRPLSELVDMYHTRKATKRHDKVYALLGMSSDDPSAAGLSANYRTSWKKVFRKLVQFSLSNQMSVDTWDKHDVAVIRGKGRIIGEVSSRDDIQGDRQNISITWKKTHSVTKRTQSSLFTLQTSAKHVQKGDVVCLLQGASKPTIIRPCSGYSAVIMIAFPLTDEVQRTATKWTNLLRPIGTFPIDLLLVWDWDVSQRKSQDQDYECFINNRKGAKRPRTRLQHDLDKATRLWNFGVLLNGMERYEDAGKNLQKAVKVYKAALRSMDTYPGHNPWTEADEEALRVMDDLVTENKGIAIEVKSDNGETPLLWAAGWGHEGVMKLLLDKGAIVEAKNNDGLTPLSRAAENGHEGIMRLLLDKGAAIEAKDNYGRTPLLWAAREGHEGIMRLLLDKGAAMEVKGNNGWTPLLWAAEEGHEAIVKLLLDKGAAIETKNNYGLTPLLRAVKKGHEAIVKLLLDKGASIKAKDNDGQTPLSWAVENGGPGPRGYGSRHRIPGSGWVYTRGERSVDRAWPSQVSACTFIVPIISWEHSHLRVFDLASSLAPWRTALAFMVRRFGENKFFGHADCVLLPIAEMRVPCWSPRAAKPDFRDKAERAKKLWVELVMKKRKGKTGGGGQSNKPVSGAFFDYIFRGQSNAIYATKHPRGVG